MRERLTFSFVVLMAFVLLLAGVVRSFTLHDLLDQNEAAHLQHDAQLVAAVVAVREQAQRDISPELLAGLVNEGQAVSVSSGTGPALFVTGSGYDADTMDDDLVAKGRAGSIEVTLRQAPTITQGLMAKMMGSLIALLVMLLLFSGSAVYAISTYISRPFRELAEMAGALGRGRFDLQAPLSPVPEVKAIASSLEGSARRLEDSIRRDREFFHHASHVLRTPLTSMQLELEGLALRDDIDDDVRRGLTRSVSEVQRLDGVVGDLLEFARGRSLVTGAEVPLATLGSNLALEWRERLPDTIELRAYVDAGGHVRLTPGPVEQLLDHVLGDIVDHARGPVTLRFAGYEDHVEIRVIGGRPKPRVEPGERPGGISAATIAEALGGRITGDVLTERGLEILLPRR